MRALRTEKERAPPPEAAALGVLDLAEHAQLEELALAEARGAASPRTGSRIREKMDQLLAKDSFTEAFVHQMSPGSPVQLGSRPLRP